MESTGWRGVLRVVVRINGSLREREPGDGFHFGRADVKGYGEAL
jgi:hypothetical protein